MIRCLEVQYTILSYMTFILIHFMYQKTLRHKRGPFVWKGIAIIAKYLFSGHTVYLCFISSKLARNYFNRKKRRWNWLGLVQLHSTEMGTRRKKGKREPTCKSTWRKTAKKEKNKAGWKSWIAGRGDSNSIEKRG